MRISKYFLRNLFNSFTTYTKKDTRNDKTKQPHENNSFCLAPPEARATFNHFCFPFSRFTFHPEGTNSKGRLGKYIVADWGLQSAARERMFARYA